MTSSFVGYNCMLINPCIITRTILTLYYFFVNNVLGFLNIVFRYTSLTFISYNTLLIKILCYNMLGIYESISGTHNLKN